MPGLTPSVLSMLTFSFLISSIFALGPNPAAASKLGLSVQELQQAFPHQPLYAVNEQEFRQFVANHRYHGQLLTGLSLASVAPSPKPDSMSGQDSLVKVQDSVHVPRALREYQERSRRQDSVTRFRRSNNLLFAKEDSLGNANESDADGKDDADASSTKGRIKGYFQNFYLDVSSSNWVGNWEGADWAAVIYVVVGVVVVGAFIVYGVHTIHELITNSEGDPIFSELGLRYSYSGKMWSDGGPPLYRNANIMGVRLALGLDRRGMGLGVGVEGGYIDLSLRKMDLPSQAFNFKGGYMVAGPLVRFGNNEPASLTFEFLNGASSHRSIGWISKSRMTVQSRVNNSGLLLGAHIGAVFYDLQFYDGLVQRQGDFNRDLSLVMGIDTGWEF